MRHINAMGKACPIPVVLTRQAMAAGESAIVTEVDNSTAVENLRRLAGNQGFAVEVGEIPGGFSVSFTREGVPCPTCGEEAGAPLLSPSLGYAVFVGRDVIGSGARELGTNLMRMFFYTLSQGEDLPRQVVFMNAGVKLPTLDGQVVEHLQALRDRGVEILVCGTCLNFYGLTEELKIGTVSNMFDIVTALQAAGKVITL